MREIARRAGGVHPSTVSLALRNAPAISKPMRERLQRLAARMGYRRDPLLDAFNARRVNRNPRRVQPTVAWVVDADSRSANALPPRLAGLWRGAQAAAEALHHQVEMFSVGPGRLPPARLAAILRARGIDCVVLASLREVRQLPDWDWGRLSAVKIDGFDWALPAFTVAADVRQGARLVVQTVRSRGYRRIGLLLDAAAERGRQDLLLSGYLVETQTGPADPIPALRVTSGLTPRALERWVKSHRIDAIVSDGPPLDPVLRLTRLVDARRPAWAAFDLTDATREAAGLVLPLDRVGALAIEQVVNLSRANQRGTVGSASSTFVPGVWRDGASLPWATPA